MHELEGKRIIVMGLGRFGGGSGLTRYLVGSGARVVVSDPADPETLADSVAALADLLPTGRLTIIPGPHEPALLDETDMLVVNPAVPRPWLNPFILEARSRNIEITTEIEIAHRKLDPCRVVAVSGSAGKSTTSAMIHHILSTTGHRSILAGNIGGSLLTRLDELSAGTLVVLELSSAMIHWLWGTGEQRDIPPAPAVACLTSYSPNHLDWHADEAHYRASKQRLLSVLPAESIAIIDESIESWRELTDARIEIIRDRVPDCTTPGAHNARNAAMALRAASAILNSSSDPSPAMVRAVQSFSGLPHRLKLCHRSDDLVFYDDSKSTVPGATVLAIDAISERFSPNRIHLIAGGYDKGSDLSPISGLAPELAGLYTIGATGRAMAQAGAAVGAHHCGALENAMTLAIERSRPGDAIVLSPGCASWDQFTNYEQRGDRFTALAKTITKKRQCSSKPSS